MRLALLRAGLSVLSIFISSVAGGAESICDVEMMRAARRNDVPLSVLYAVALTETGQHGALHAYAMNIDGKPVFNSDLSEALVAFAAAKRRGAKLIDIGCMQVNHHFHGSQFANVEEMFQPARNVDYAARFLKALQVSERSWTGAVARYHAGPGNRPAQKKYVCAVITNMIAAGFGRWTQQSRGFCETNRN